MALSASVGVIRDPIPHYLYLRRERFKRRKNAQILMDRSMCRHRGIWCHARRVPPKGTTVNATVTCGPFGQVTSDLGLVNTFGGALGTLAHVSDENKSVQRRLTLRASDTSQPNPIIESSTLIKGANLSIALSAKVPAAVEAAIKSDISSNTKCHVVQDRSGRSAGD
jgi:hypothetical protein